MDELTSIPINQLSVLHVYGPIIGIPLQTGRKAAFRCVAGMASMERDGRGWECDGGRRAGGGGGGEGVDHLPVFSSVSSWPALSAKWKASSTGVRRAESIRRRRIFACDAQR